jgi:hypothetical protein
VAALRESEVCIWYRCTELLDGDSVKLADRHLSIEERARRDRLHFEVDRRDFTIAHDLLRVHSLGMQTNHPLIGASPLTIAVSHSPKIAILKTRIVIEPFAYSRLRRLCDQPKVAGRDRCGTSPQIRASPRNSG